MSGRRLTARQQLQVRRRFRESQRQSTVLLKQMNIQLKRLTPIMKELDSLSRKLDEMSSEMEKIRERNGDKDTNRPLSPVMPDDTRRVIDYDLTAQTHAVPVRGFAYS